MDKYLLMLKNLAPIYIYLLVDIMIKNGSSKLIQRAVVYSGKNILVDGVIGYNTVKAILSLDPTKFVSSLNDVMLQLDKKTRLELQETNEDYILNYLAKAEGTTVHWNKKETNFTTPYGVYAKSFPISEPVVYVKSLFYKYKLKITKTNARKINTKLTNSEKIKIRKLVYAFYVKNFMDARVNALLGKKSSLSYFSISVNTGMTRGNKALQSSVGAIIDGVIGRMTLLILKNTKLSDSQINIKLLKYLKDFYLYLIRVNPEKYSLNRNGWFNRIKGLM